jgi:hypothetical protein
MSKTTLTRGRRVALVRALLQDPAKLCGPRETVLPLSLVERCRGGEFARWDARYDLAITLAKLQVHVNDGLPKTLDRAVAKACNAPTVRNVARVRMLVVRAVDLSNLGDADALACVEIATSLLFHEAALGCSLANGACSAMCLSQADRDLREGRDAEAWHGLRAALHYAANSQVDYSDTTYIPEPLYTQLPFYDTAADRWASALGVVVSARDQISAAEDVQDAILKGGVGVPAEGLADFDGLYPADIEGLIQAAAPTLTVIADHGLDHLPGSAESGSSTRPASRSFTPRGEWQPMVGKAVPLVHGADVRAAAAVLDAEFPWLVDVTSVLLQDLVGARYTRIRPSLLLGKPGGGKTRYARRVAEVLGLPVTIYSAAGVADAAFGGTSRQWSTGRACVPLQAIQRSGVANPCIIIDEIEKAGTRSENGKLIDSLVAMIEPEGAQSFFDQYLETPVNLSAPSYLATANGTGGLSGALLDRLRIVRVPDPRAQDLPVVASAIVGGIRSERGLDLAWLPDLDPDELDLIARRWRGGSLRPLRRLVETVVAGRDTLARRH